MAGNSAFGGPLPIRLVLPLIIGIGGVITLSAFTVLEINNAQRVVEEQGRGDVAVLMSNLQGAITHRLRRDDLTGVQNVIANQSFHEHIKQVVFVNEQERVIAATQLALVGHPLASAVARLNAELAVCKGNRWKGVVRASADGTSLFGCYPVALLSDTGDMQSLQTGYLLSLYDLTRLQSLARQQVNLRVAIFWLLFAAGFGMVLLVLRQTLARRRIKQIVDTIFRFAAGDLNARVELPGRDELATISQAVDGMAEQLQAATNALRQTHDELEQRVQARTAELRKNEERYRTLIDFNPLAVFVHFDRRIVYANSAAVRLFGAATADDLIGRSAFDMVPKDCLAEIEERYRCAIETGMPNPPIYQQRLRLDGSVIEVEATAAPVAWESGTAMQVIMRDLSEQRKAERWVRTLIEATQDAVVSIDREGRVILFNPAAERIFGYKKAEMQGKKVNLLMAEPYASEHDDYLARYETTGESKAIGRTRTVAGRRKNGENFPIELSVTRIVSGGEINYAAFIRDISDRAKLQSELIQKERLAAIGATAARFAHEIGNPLNGMYMTAQLLERRLVNAGIDDEKVLSSFQSIVAEMRRLNTLLSEFRSLYREELYSFHPTSLATVIRDVLNMERANYISRGIHIEESVAPDLPTFSADGDKLKQALLNLCKNGVEAMPQGGTLRVRATRNGNDAVVEVSDSGIGIDTDTDVFTPFKTTKPSGTGLGLVIARQVVTAHNGSITYRSEPGKGTTFSIRLPLKKDEG